ncbi:XRE family transcriptional regulator [Streptomyces reniochalinae]|uniref:XRE family transcriptional regulator n=1 Tax=Streptomyces reniochalinae TaxID=2250578 RepID=A0A367EAH9_9ACTN|nr:helix-turn-helix transcriptional regulator [Streptomyces reniochalinae]RCG15074.1 XRE family transcriptional regulator [Streptomyces reniochalinae]
MAKRTVEFGPVGIHTARNIERVRRSLGLTQSVVAYRCTALGRPLATTALSRTEQARRRCDVDDLVAIAAALRVHPCSLLFVPPAAPLG